LHDFHDEVGQIIELLLLLAVKIQFFGDPFADEFGLLGG